MAPTLTTKERGKITAIKNHMRTVEYGSASRNYITSLLAIIERLTSDPEPTPVTNKATTP